MLQDLKDYLKITYEAEDAYLSSVIQRGKAYLSDVTGVELDFEKEGLTKSLLLDYCRYYYHNNIEYFEENFISQIINLRYRRE